MTDLRQRVVVYHNTDGVDYTHSLLIISPSGREQETLRLSADESVHLANILLGDVQDHDGQADHTDEIVTGDERGEEELPEEELPE